MDSQIFATWVTAAAAAVYTVGTFLLWWTTRRTLRAMRDAFRLNFLLACREATRTTVFPTDLVGRMTEQAEILKRLFPDDADLVLVALRNEPDKR
jgi:hypothetical protein